MNTEDFKMAKNVQETTSAPEYFLTSGEVSEVMYNLDLRGRRISLSLDAVDEASRKLFCESLTQQLIETDQLAEVETREHFQGLCRDLFGFNNGGRA